MGNNYAVLFVDDEENILSSLKRGLIDEDYDRYFVNSGEKALQMMEKQSFAVIVTDMKMPGMDGLVLLKEVKKRYPKTVRIVLSGFTQLQQVLTTINQVDVFKFLTKPWKMEEEFIGVVRKGIEYYKLQVEAEEMKMTLENQNIAYQNILKRIDEVVDEKRKNTEMIKNAGISAFNNLLTLTSKDSNIIDSDKAIKFTSRVFQVVAENVANEYLDTTFDNLVRELENKLKGIESIIKVDTENQFRNLKINMSSKYVLLGNIMKKVVELLCEDNEKNYVKIMVNGTIGSDKGISLVILLAGMNEKMHNIVKEKKDREIGAKITILNNVLGGIFENGYACVKIDNNIAQKIII